MEVIDKLVKTHGNQCVLEKFSPSDRRIFVTVNKECFKDAIQFLKTEGFAHLSAITGLEVGDEIELLYHLNKEGAVVTVRLKVPLSEIIVPTITDIIPGSNLYERELHDLLGVKFPGHPNLARLILSDDWPENIYPLRKRGRSKETSEQ